MLPRSLLITTVLTALLVGAGGWGTINDAQGQEPAAGPASQAETPEDVTAKMVAAMRDKDWTGLARLMHPTALQELRSLFDVLINAPGAEASDVRNQLFGVSTAEEARALSDTVMFANMMRTFMEASGGLSDMLAGAEVRILGQVPEGQDTVHVVYRMTMTVEKIPMSIMDVATLMRHNHTWRGLLKGDLKAMVAGIKAAVTKQS